ncbi:MAG: hypothetical protein E5X63_11805 [Mesorhizobium sp.]|nr:MAG: hypothetical protein E5X63_11805 [Mesorhizobium sp.]
MPFKWRYPIKRHEIDLHAQDSRFRTPTGYLYNMNESQNGQHLLCLGRPALLKHPTGIPQDESGPETRHFMPFRKANRLAAQTGVE